MSLARKFDAALREGSPCALKTLEVVRALGDVPGHEFHGNQYSGGGGGSNPKPAGGATKAIGLAAAPQKIPQALVLYMGPDLNEKDFTCGGCTFSTPDSECALLEPSKVDLEHGACGLYVPGEPHSQPMLSEPVPAKVAGYEADGPFTCGRCDHFISPSSCEGVAGTVAAAGCCNAWEKA